MFLLSSNLDPSHTGMSPGTMPREESMVNDAVQHGMQLRVRCEDLLNKLARVERDIEVEQEPVAIIVDVPERGQFQLHHVMAGTSELCTMKNHASDFVKTRRRWSMLTREPFGQSSRVI